jgi:hypothetical protein
MGQGFIEHFIQQSLKRRNVMQMRVSKMNRLRREGYESAFFGPGEVRFFLLQTHFPE